MKKSLIEGSKISNEVMVKCGPIKQGLMTIYKDSHKVAHAVSYIDGMGVTYTTKDQRSDGFLINKTGGSFSYAQRFINNEIVCKSEMKNPNLINLLNNRGAFEAVYSHSLALKMKNPTIVFNDKNKQFLKNLENSQLKESKNFLNKCGGVDVVDRAFEHMGNIINITNIARKMLYELSNADPSSKSVIYFKNKDIYDILSELEKTGNLKHNDELFKIKVGIEKIIEN